MTLLHEYLLIEPKTESRTAGGIIIPETSQDKQLTGTVRAIGSGVDDRDIHTGDTVIYDKLNSSLIEIEHVSYVICEYDDIIAVL